MIYNINEYWKINSQLTNIFLSQSYVPEKARAITEEEKKHSVFQEMRVARSHAKYWGIRAKRKKEAEEAAKLAKPKKK